MSIATLKRKTNLGGNPRNDPISGIGNKGFALNGSPLLCPWRGHE